MKKYSKQAISFGVILVLSAFTVLCCKPSQMAMAQGSYPFVGTNTSMPACHAHAKKTAVPTKGDCDCCLTKKLLQADALTKISFKPEQIFVGFTTEDVSSELSLVLKPQFNLAFLDGPPGPTVESPLYIHFHNIRI